MPIKTYDTGERPCQYIVGETARFLVHSFQPTTTKNAEQRNARNRAFKLRLIKAGYFNQTEGAGEFKCPDCRKCFSAAVKISHYEPNKDQRKILRKNANVEFSITEPYAYRELYDLLRSYIQERHPQSNMVHLTFEQFRQKTLAHSHMALLKLKGEIVACSWIDADDEIIVGDYCFYDIEKSKERRLGNLMDLKLLEYAAEKNIPWVTFGPINDESPKLKHKGQYAGTHAFDNGRWTPYQRPSQG